MQTLDADADEYVDEEGNVGESFGQAPERSERCMREIFCDTPSPDTLHGSFLTFCFFFFLISVPWTTSASSENHFPSGLKKNQKVR